MIHFQIPPNSKQLYKDVDCAGEYYIIPPPGFSSKYEEFPGPIISQSLSYYLYDIKERIDSYEREWDIFKRYTNPYEYIHTTIPSCITKNEDPAKPTYLFLNNGMSVYIPKYKSVSKYKPLSRSYFKMIEITNFFRLLDTVPSYAMRSFHLAEGPGGFIEALVKMRESPKDQYIGMTILDDVADPNIPAWKKSERFLKENPNVEIETGQDGTGDILSLANFDYCVEKYASSMDIITGDGGFDFSSDFNNQEIQISRLLFAQVAFALGMQKRGGSFILKIFDCFMQHSIDILAILSSFYEKVYITKPQTSRYANSEKYVVCKGFLYDNSNASFMPYIRDTFIKMTGNKDTAACEYRICRFLKVPLNMYFVSRIEELNAIFGQQQIENIYNTISLIESKNKGEKINTLVKANIEKCIYWCAKHNISSL
jgi:23S rRNA U2552 (ribose-2'-O)-methylase RlmE/FtsJ